VDNASAAGWTEKQEQKRASETATKAPIPQPNSRAVLSYLSNQKKDPPATVDNTPAPPNPKRLIKAVPPDSGSGPLGDDALECFKRTILSAGLDHDLAEELVAEIHDRMAAGGTVDASRIKRVFDAMLTERIEIAPPLRIGEFRPKIVALVGPTGVGKTTTIAKLAAHHAMTNRCRVALVSLEGEHLSGGGSLCTYSKIIDIPLARAHDHASLIQAIRQFDDRQLILVDTPGISACDGPGLEKMAKLLSRIEPDEVHLTLNAATKDSDLMAIHAKYRRLGINRLLFTKLDETFSHGNLLNLLLRVPVKPSYVATGPEIPEHFESATILGFSDRVYVPGDFKHEEASSQERLINMPFRRTQKPSFEEGCLVANKNSDIFHRPECKSVKRINTDNIIVFNHFDEALDRHFKPCRMCCQTAPARKGLFQPHPKQAVSGF
jgi:flagellar biosynthesis protein FlhF